MSHTPTPWKVDVWHYNRPYPHPNSNDLKQVSELKIRNQDILIGTLECDYIGDNPYTIPQKEAEANAAHIVHCVNVHDQLVEALKMAKDTLAIFSGADDQQTYIGEAVHKAKQALAAAEKGASV